MDFAPAKLRARFAELGEQRDTIIDASLPLREERDAISAAASAQVAALDNRICDLEAGLFDLDQERAMIARALGGRTGDPVEAE